MKNENMGQRILIIIKKNKRKWKQKKKSIIGCVFEQQFIKPSFQNGY